jgi:hypothetical protein
VLHMLAIVVLILLGEYGAPAALGRR